MRTITVEDKYDVLAEMIAEDWDGADEYLELLIEWCADEDEEHRRLVLLAYLRDQGNTWYSPEDIDNQWENVFAVNPHTVKDGTSPGRARELAALVRTALQRVLDALPKANPKARRIKDRSACQVFVNREPDEVCSEESARMLPKDASKWTTKDLADAAALRKRLDNWEFEDRSSIIHLQDPRLALIPTYDTLVALFRELCPDLVEKGIHDLVNSLYYLCPETDGYDHASDHRETLREAFNGQEPKDRRTSRKTNDAEYLVVTDEEADSLWDDSLESYIDNCLEIPEPVSSYFDREKWKDDAKMDGRGHSLNGYDGTEDESHDFYIYRQN
jgi:hypothetical protein